MEEIDEILHKKELKERCKYVWEEFSSWRYWNV